MKNKINKRGSSYRNDFSIADGMEIQAQDMNRWKKCLNAVAYELLAKKVNEKNDKLHIKVADSQDIDGYDVYRGGSLSNFINNLFLE